jgi:hypothetical protein
MVASDAIAEVSGLSITMVSHNFLNRSNVIVFPLICGFWYEKGGFYFILLLISRVFSYKYTSIHALCAHTGKTRVNKKGPASDFSEQGSL